MRRAGSAGRILLIGLVLAASGLFALKHSHSAAWRLSADERPWVERTVDLAVVRTETRGAASDRALACALHRIFTGTARRAHHPDPAIR